MKKLFHNRYFSFLMIYLCIISIVGLSLSFSRYTSGDTKTEDARAAIYDVEIHSGDLQSVEQNMTMTVYATSKISETKSMIDGTYEKKQVNIHNFSECDISLSDMGIQDQTGNLYEKLIIPMNEEEITAYETKCGSIPLMVLDYLGKTEAELADYTKVRDIINKKNEESFEAIENRGTIDTGESRTFFIISWVEHDNIYKADADLNEDKISHKTLKELNAESESFTIKLTSAQVD